MNKNKHRLYFRICYSVVFVAILVAALTLDIMLITGTTFQSLAMVALPSIMAIAINDYRSKPGVNDEDK